MPTTSEDRWVVPGQLDALIHADRADLIGLRRQLHSHPELSGAETATTELVARHLRDLGLAPSKLATGTGLVCDVAIGTGAGPVVALRADLDALAMEDDKDVAYRSTVAGVAHACGHDVHTTVLVGAARALVALGRDAGVSGTVRLVFEPAEESVPGGAVDVIAEGFLDGVGHIFGLHCDPKIDVGQIGCRVGALTSAADMVEVRLRGPGGHTARPGLTVDLVEVLGRLIANLQPAIDRLVGAPGVLQLVFGAVHAGDAANVIPAHGWLRGTLRTRDHAVWVKAPDVFERAVVEVLGVTGASFEIGHRRGVPPVVNDEAATELLVDAVRAALGEDAVVPTEQSMGGDSFAWYLEQVPGSYARLGVHDPASDQPRLDLHASTFDVDERAIGLGVKVLVATALRALEA